MGDYLACPRLYRYKHIDRRVPRHLSKRLQYGLLGHKTLENHARGITYPDPGFYPSLDEHDRAAFPILMAGYHLMWSDGAQPIEGFVEKYFEVEITPWLTLAGTVDIAYREHGQPDALGDHKFTAEDIGPDGSIQKRLRLDKQISIYLLASQLLGWGMRRFIYDMIRKPGAPLKATANPRYTKEKKCSKCPGDGCQKCGGSGTIAPRLYAGDRESDETPKEYARRVADDIAAAPSRWYRRESVFRTSSQLEEARQDLIDVGRLVRVGAFPKNDRACNRMFGERCAFYGVCTGSARLDDDSMFKDSDR